jgi:hypothetical protein
MPAISGQIATATRLAARAMSLLTADAIPACYTDYVYVMEFDGDHWIWPERAETGGRT